MVTARRSLVLTLTIFAAALVFPYYTWAAVGSPQTCTTSTNCTIGEFLYDDSYTPITTADICTLNAKNPDGSAYITNQNMPPSAQNDGWYSHTFTASSTEGYYRAEVCCSPGGQKMCLDKSFEVKAASSSAPSDIATAVWGYSGRTLSSFGTLVTDIWNNATRLLTGADLSSGKLATQSDVSSVSSKIDNVSTVSASLSSLTNTVNESRLLLEKLVNKPVIQNSIEEAPSLQGKLDESKTVANRVFINNQYIISKTDLLIMNWDKLSDKNKLDTVLDLNNVLGEQTDKEGTDSLFGQANWLAKQWDWQVADDILSQAKIIKSGLTSAQQKLASGSKSTSAFIDINGIGNNLTSLEKLLGNSTDSSDAKTAFGKIKGIQDLADTFGQRQKEVMGLLTEVKTKKNTSVLDKIDSLYGRILALNTVPKPSAIFASTFKDISGDKLLKNKLLGMNALIDANEILLAKGAGASFGNTWLEEGSMVFKTLVTNPSTLISQTVPVKYYLPVEVKKEDIISVDDGLTVKFDSDKNQYYAEGSFLLAPGETRTISVRAQDVWTITQQEVDTLRNQAAELSKPLEKTSFFAQGVTLKSDIDVSLDKVIALQEAAVTPDERIRAYREAEIEYKAAQDKVSKLKDLVGQASGAGSLFGFIGGAQAMAVWGLIIIMAAGFVFLALYMRSITQGRKAVAKAEAKVAVNGKTPRLPSRGIARMVLPVIFFGISTAAVSGIGVKILMQRQIAKIDGELQAAIQKSQILGASEVKATPTPIAVGGPDNGVSLDEAASKAAELQKVVVIGETPTGWLRVRQEPNGAEIAKVNPGEKYPVFSEEKDWWQIILADGTKGWISKDYSSEN